MIWPALKKSQACDKVLHGIRCETGNITMGYKMDGAAGRNYNEMYSICGTVWTRKEQVLSQQKMRKNYSNIYICPDGTLQQYGTLLKLHTKEKIAGITPDRKKRGVERTDVRKKALLLALCRFMSIWLLIRDVTSDLSLNLWRTEGRSTTWQKFSLKPF